MKAGLVVGLWLGFAMLLGYLGQIVGLTQEAVTPWAIAPNEPGSGSFLSNILAPLVWVWTAANSFVQLITFQAEGVPASVVVFVFWPINAVFGFMFVKLIRG